MQPYPRASRSRFTELHIWPQNAYFAPNNFFAECRQIAYLDPKILILNWKKFWLLESVHRGLKRVLGHRRLIFQNGAKSHNWILKYKFLSKKKLTPRDCWSAAPTCLGASEKVFFRIPLNWIFVPREAFWNWEIITRL